MAIFTISCQASIDKNGLKHKQRDLNSIRKKVPLLVRQAPTHTAESSKKSSTKKADSVGSKIKPSNSQLSKSSKASNSIAKVVNFTPSENAVKTTAITMTISNATPAAATATGASSAPVVPPAAPTGLNETQPSDQSSSNNGSTDSAIATSAADPSSQTSSMLEFGFLSVMIVFGILT
ncbi:4101_t:CDS:2 [Racocetra fulgida]|uniref:4101_t:CDS:1 n=1 Tax=Racocetra fulgida TaxID=60492 RepID=A0A9N8WPQ6_9GLOM|nr:4101_t:CDS:2 [Racocetra fulgida]